MGEADHFLSLWMIDKWVWLAHGLQYCFTPILGLSSLFRVFPHDY